MVDDTKIAGYMHKHWNLFPTVWHLSRLSQGRTQGRQKCVLLSWGSQIVATVSVYAADVRSVFDS